MPEAPQIARWIERTPEGFVFSVKLFQKFTHPDMHLAHGAADWEPSRVDIDLFRAGIAPLAEAGRLGALLMQFPPSFHGGVDERAYLEWLLDAFAAYPTAVELRHKSWSDQTSDVAALLDAHGAAWVLIDEPKFASSIVQNVIDPGGFAPADPLTRSLAGTPGPRSVRAARPGLTYLRLHGRNAAQWWEHEVAEDRYNYLYSADELEPFAERAKADAAAGRKVYLYLNNHFSAKAVANAAVLQKKTGREPSGDYNLTFRMTYEV
jgi:uncharacterized protein YecE (DUF72 family)